MVNVYLCYISLQRLKLIKPKFTGNVLFLINGSTQFNQLRTVWTSKIFVQKCSQQTPIAKIAKKFGLIGIKILPIMFRNTTICPMGKVGSKSNICSVFAQDMPTANWTITFQLFSEIKIS